MEITLNNEIYRDAMTGVRWLWAIECLDALPQDSIDDLVLTSFLESVESILPRESDRES